MNNELTSSTIIAAVLAAEFGEPGQPQIGLFDTAAAQCADLPRAQQQFTDWLIETLMATCASSPSRVLLAGEALGPVAQALAQRQHQVLWLAGSAAPAQHLAPASAPDLQVAAQSLLTAIASGPFDCLMVAGTFRYLDQLPIFNRCRQLLQANGHLFICGEFLQDDSDIAYSTLANLSSHRQLGERLGFRAERVHDLSASARQSVRLFNDMLGRHGAAVCASLQLASSAWSTWQALFGTMAQELQSGRRCYQLHHWRLPDVAQDPACKAQLGEYATAEYGDIDSFAIGEIGDLFEQSFGKRFDPALWRWKYQQGNGKCVVARIEPGGPVVAHYGGAPRQIRYFNTPGMAIQVCDVMVLPEKRRQYGKSSLFFKVAATFLEREIGNTVKHLLGFGFPNQSAMNIAKRLGLYEKTDDFVELVFPPVTPAGTDNFLEFDSGNAAHLAHVDQLWEAMARDFSAGIIGLRDAAYIKYRYCEHPGAAAQQFRCLLLSAPGSDDCTALVVLKQHGTDVLLLDLVCPLGQMPATLDAVNQLVRSQSPEAALRLWLTRGWLQALPLEGVIVNELGIEIPCNSWNPGPAAATLYGKWWLTAGDMDFM